MEDNSRVRNLSVLIVLMVAYIVPAIFISARTMLDIVSVPMLVFGLYSLWLVFGEAWNDFWNGRQDRAAMGLFALTAILISVVVMRPYGIVTRNIQGTEWLESTHIYAVALYVQAIGLWLFTRGAAPAHLESRNPGWGQLIAGIVIGAVVASSKVLEPILAGIGKIAGRLF